MSIACDLGFLVSNVLHARTPFPAPAHLADRTLLLVNAPRLHVEGDKLIGTQPYGALSRPGPEGHGIVTYEIDLAARRGRMSTTVADGRPGATSPWVALDRGARRDFNKAVKACGDDPTLAAQLQAAKRLLRL